MGRVLVVDDDEGILEVLREALQRAGHSVREAADGASALAQALSEPVDVVLLDVVMPVKGGLETLMELRRSLPDTGVILMSGTAQTSAEPFRNLAGRLGVRYVFTKPLDLEAVIEAVGSLCLQAPTAKPGEKPAGDGTAGDSRPGPRDPGPSRG